MKSVMSANAASAPNKYPDSVHAVSGLLKQAIKDEDERTEDRSQQVTYNEEGEAEKSDSHSYASSSDSSESSTPRGSPTPSVSFGHHICGSLFAKCAEHGRSQLLETFTNPHSHLSQQTFTKRHLKQKCEAFDELFRKTKIEVTESKISENSTRAYQDLADGTAGLQVVEKTENKTVIKADNGSIFANAKVRYEKSNCKSTDLQIKPIQRLLVRRHNSLPNKTLEPEVLHQLKEIFANANEDSSDDRLSDDDEDDETIPDIKRFIRGRSKSEGKITRVVHNDRKVTGSGRNMEKLEELETTQIHTEICKRCLDQSSSYNLRNSSAEVEESLTVERSKVAGTEDASGRHCCAFRTDDEKNGNRFRLVVDSCSFHPDTDCLRSVIAQLRTENKQWAHKVDFLETEILLLRRELKKRDKENITLQREVNKLRSVLQQTSIFKQEDILSSLQDSHGMPGQVQQIIAVPNPNKKQGVSGESSDNGRKLDQIEIQRFDKDFRSKQLIKDAIMENDFLKNLDSSQVREIVESVYPKEFETGSYVIKEGEAGSHLYVSAEGEFEVIKEHKILGRMGPGKAFGELAILYNCRRTASIKVASDAKVWVLDRRVFQQIMMKTGLQRLQENVNFLRSVPLLQPLNNDVLAKIADVLEVDFYPSGAHIIRQGASGDTFFIISSGRVKVTQQKPGRQEEEEIRILGKGDYFGEQALLKEDWRTANVIALNPGVECLTLDRESFIQLIGDLSELQEKNYEDQEKRGFSRPSSNVSLCDKEEYDYIRLEDLEVISTLGVGGFGRVELVQYTSNKSMTFALKCLKKQHIVDTQQQEHVYSERNIMMACNSQFICRLYRTFRDSKYVYMLLEACLGGEVWTILRERGYFDDYTTKFVTGCVIEAFEYLHARGIIYRDLKPENLLLDNVGYVKLVDFGFSKRLGFSSKTWTFCGTPEYVAPEIILNKGHDRAVDYWSLGILMHELLTGTPPFTAPDPMRTYNIILKGIDMIDFPKHITRAAQSLIKRLCRDSPSERLGYQRGGIEDIKKHKWFQGFDWHGLKQRALGPPITPLVRGPTDASNFDYYSKETDLPPDEFSNWDAEF